MSDKTRICDCCEKEIPNGEILFGVSDELGDVQLCQECWLKLNEP